MIIQDMPSGYRSVLDHVLAHGKKRCSRGLTHYEVVGFQLTMHHPELPLATEVGRGLNNKIAYVEALQLISGESYPNLLSKVSGGSFDRFKNGEVLHGAYGPRLRPQMETLVRRLLDSDSRQAVVTVWDPFQDMQDRRDLPCTVAMQFMLRDDQLHMITTMRSNDVWLGFPYDVFQFTQLQCTLANVMSVYPGTYVHNVGSMHIYAGDVTKSGDVWSRHASSDDIYQGMTATTDWNGANVHERWKIAQRTANALLEGTAAQHYDLDDGLPLRAWESLHA